MKKHVKPNSRRLVHGVGTNNVFDIDQATRHLCSVWRGMLRRCYSESQLIKDPTYRGCTVCDEWHLFSNFRVWALSQNWYRNHMDKDTIKPGNKVYGPETCAFIPQELNKLLTSRQNARGKYPQGVIKIKETGRFRARLTMFGKKKHLGVSSTPEKASQVYRDAKADHIEEIACLFDPRIEQGLIKHAQGYRT